MKTQQTENQTTLGILAILASSISVNAGAAFAKHLFPLIGAAGMTTLRIGFAALILMIICRPWRKLPDLQSLKTIALYGIILGFMNLLIYQAFARIPIGIAIAIEILGPLGVVLASARRVIDFVWFILAVVGLCLFLPLQTNEVSLDLVGILFAIAAALSWACYILVGKKLSSGSTLNTVALGMFIATCVAAPFGIMEAGMALLSPSVLWMGLLVALFSSALPFPLEMMALKRLPTHIFSIIVSASPIIAALCGWIILGEELLRHQWIAIFLIVIAIAGSTFKKS
ncbi:EamA family transporter [Sulfurospirillum sp.]|jgi:inner membrane transporter RhtA|uniref:EamA family transporter n=1 Tax=Sulfurospirillum sp. TaxID=2053622 RepID=UPI002FDD277E